MKYRKKPVIIEAVQLVNPISLDPEDHPQWFVDAVMNNTIKVVRGAFTGNVKFAEIKTLEGTMTADLGDYIIRGVKGELYPCKPDIFEKTYEKVMEQKELR